MTSLTVDPELSTRFRVRPPWRIKRANCLRLSVIGCRPGRPLESDLMTTCFSRHSRNRSVGERLGRGESLADILASVESIAEGVTTTRSVHELAAKKGIDMPITAEVFAVLFENRSPTEATKSLMLRPLREE